MTRPVTLSKAKWRILAEQIVKNMPATIKLEYLSMYMDYYIDKLPKKRIMVTFTRWMENKFTDLLYNCRQKAINQFSKNCFYCEIELDESKMMRTRDHIIPQSKGGKSLPGNIIPCCNTCNGWKGSKDLEDWAFEVRHCLSRKIGKRKYSKHDIEKILNNIQKIKKCHNSNVLNTPTVKSLPPSAKALLRPSLSSV